MEGPWKSIQEPIFSPKDSLKTTMATPELPEPMNSSPHHSKVKISTTLSDPTFVAGNFVSGKLDMECRADNGLGIGILMVELFAIQGSLSSVYFNERES